MQKIVDTLAEPINTHQAGESYCGSAARIQPKRKCRQMRRAMERSHHAERTRLAIFDPGSRIPRQKKAGHVDYLQSIRGGQVSLEGSGAVPWGMACGGHLFSETESESRELHLLSDSPRRVPLSRARRRSCGGLARNEETIGAWLTGSRVAARALAARQRPRERDVSLTSGAPPRGEGDRRARTARGVLVSRDREAPAGAALRQCCWGGLLQSADGARHACYARS